MRKVHHQSIKKIWNIKGPQKLKYFCQMCEKQCRDQHGFDAHCSSGGHVNQMLLFAENKDHYLEAHSKEFQSEFMSLLRSKFKEPTELNVVYQEYIRNSDHMHLNATKWSTLTQFAQHLTNSGLIRVEDRDSKAYITAVDMVGESSLQKLNKHDKPTISEEQRERIKLQRLIEKARQEKGDKVETEKEYKPVTGEFKVELNFKPMVQKKVLKKSKLLK